MTQQTTIAVLGLGEAGGAFARDLIAADATVRAFDPQSRHRSEPSRAGPRPRPSTPPTSSSA